MQLMSDPVSRSKGIGFMDPARMEADYELVKSFIGITTPYDVKAFYTDRYLDPSIKMVSIPDSPFN
jgi:NitT/TauT family transport system substrate-binding protein